VGTTGSTGDQRPAGRETEPSRSETPDAPTQLDKAAWFGVLKRSAKGFKRDNLSDWAAALTYRSVLCLAPGLLILVAILGLLGKSTTDKLLTNVGDLAPGGVRSVIEQIVHSVQGSGPLGWSG
jgi:membrane protein